jgi:uncharacterized coiled-coil protein SlyX
MTFDEFKSKWNGKGIDFDGAYGDQCMDLMHQYCVEVLGITDGRVLAAPAAKDVWNTPVFGKDKFESIANSPTGVPQKGDIVLFGTEVGPYGHVAIVQSADVNTVTTFDQNWSGHQYCETITHKYGGSQGVLGWLRFKGQPTTTPIPDTSSLQAELDKTRAERDKNWNLYSPFKDAGYDNVDKVKAELKSKQDTIDNLNQQINDRNNDITQLNSKLSTLEATVLDLTTQRDSALNQAKPLPQITAERDELLSQKDIWNKKEKDYLKKISDLTKENSGLKSDSTSAAFVALLKKIFPFL